MDDSLPIADAQMNQQSVDFLQAEPPLSSPIIWADMDILAVDTKRMARHRIVAVGRSDPAHLAIDMLRTRVLRSAREDKWNTLAVTSPTGGCGKATITLNLAISLAKQFDLRIVLVDLDLRQPKLAQILGHNPEFSTEDYLTGKCRTEEFFVRIGENLAIGASPESLPHPAELLHDTRTTWSLKRLRQTLRPDIVIYNLPPMLLSDDCAGFLGNVDMTLLVVAAEASTVAEIDLCERELADQSKLLGVVLNKCRYKTEQYDNYQS
jgi:protein-tyrosine kinase